MNDFGTNIYAAQRIVQFRTEERIHEAEQARTARAFRQAGPDRERSSRRRVRRSFRRAWAVRRAAA